MSSLRARLTAWYALLLVLTVAIFSMAVLWLHWRLLIEQLDAGLTSIVVTANNVVDEELTELNDLRQAAREMALVVRPPLAVVQVLSVSGVPIDRTDVGMPLPPEVRSPGVAHLTRTLTGTDGRLWRVTVHAAAGHGHPYVVAVGAPLDGVLAQWWTLLRACLIGIPIALVVAVAGGLWVGRHGLRPLTAMAAQSQTITAETLDRRLTVPRAAAELEQLGAAFNRVLDRLGQALSTQRQFMADASHELRTPISIMRTAADVTLSLPSRDEAEYRDALAAVAQQSVRLTRLVDDMLVLARADGGGYPMRLTSVDMTALVRECVRELEGLAAERAIAVRTDLAPAAIHGDEGLLRRMCSNLLGNALTYTPRGGAVEVSLAPGPDGIVLRVSDTGPGVPPGDQERVFERFVRLDPARSAGGAGLGLAIARWVAEAHGGALRIEASGPGGSIFAASLPA